ncbi:MAG: hypothetical protein Q9161_009144 [Pseudevernia consocians]
MAAAPIPDVPRAGQREAIAIYPRIAAIRGAGDIVPETENITTHLAIHLLSSPSPPPPTLRILDLCTGTGCVPLHLHSLLALHLPSLHLHGIDISPSATALATKNLIHNLNNHALQQTARAQISFTQADIFAPKSQQWRRSHWDVVISNPPYISPSAFNTTTSRSVRNYEPKSALVPSPTHALDQNRGAEETAGDTFYPRLLDLAEQVGAQVLLVEVADMEQAVRVARMVLAESKGVWAGCEIWRDWPAAGGEGEEEVVEVDGGKVRIKGEGNGRAVLAWRGGDGGRMIGKKSAFDSG